MIPGDNIIEQAAQLQQILSSGDTQYNEILKSIDIEKLKVGLDFVLQHPALSNLQKANLLKDSWRLNYKSKPPTPEEFLTYKYIGPMADDLYPRVRKWFLEFFEEGKAHRNAVLYPFIGAGKSTLAVLINLYVTVHVALMRNPKKLFGLSGITRLAFVLYSFNLDKAAETLLEPFISLLENSEFFERCRTKEDMIKKEREYQDNRDEVSKIYWTTASRNGVYALQFSNGINYKLASAPHHIIGLTIVCGTLTELAFFREAGKALSLDSKVMTPTGFIKMGDIKIGDVVSTPNGKTATVTQVRPQGKTKAYQVSFSDGRKVVANPEHEWRVKKNRSWVIRTTQELFENNNDPKHRWVIPLSAPVYFNESDHFISPYLLGFMLGDGDRDRASSESNLTNQINPEYQLSHSGHQSFRIVKKEKNYQIKNRYCEEIRRLGLEETRSATKFIPTCYLIDSVENRIGLLQGLMDTDGWAGKRGEAVFSTTSPLLAEGVQNLVRGLGGFASIQTRQDLRKESYLMTYKVQLSFPNNNFPVFRLDRKQERINHWFSQKSRNSRQHLAISSITQMGDTETQCITIDSDDHLFLTNDFIVTKNSDEFIMRSFNDMKKRVWSRMKNTNISRYWGRTILDSSPNDLESPIDNYCMFEADKDSKNYVVKGSHWKWVPEDYDPGELEDTFAVFRGGSGKPPRILTSEEGIDASDIIRVPRFQSGQSLYQMFADDLVKSLKDLAGIPQGSLDKLFYDYDRIEECFVPSLKSVNYAIKADSRMSPFGLIWNQVHHDFFTRSGSGYHFWYKPKIPRVFHIDQSVSTDMTAIAFVHVERKDNPQGFDVSRDMVYVVDFVIPIHPMGGRINLDSIKEFIKDVYTRGGVSIIAGSYDTYQSESAIQDLERSGIEMENISVDETMDPYIFLSQLIEQGNLKLGPNIFFKNNLKSLRITQTKIAKRMKVDHTNGETVDPATGDHNWSTSLLGINAKDISDAVAGAVYNAKLHLAQDGRSLSQVWQEDTVVVTSEMLRDRVLAQLREMGLLG